MPFVPNTVDATHPLELLAGIAVLRKRKRHRDTRALPVRKTIHHDAEDYAPVFQQDLEPGAGALLRKVDAAEAEARNQMTELISRWRAGDLSHCAPCILGTIGIGPSVLDLLMHRPHGHLQWRMRHLERPKIEPVRGARQASVLQQPVIERCGRERSDL